MDNRFYPCPVGMIVSESQGRSFPQSMHKADSLFNMRSSERSNQFRDTRHWTAKDKQAHELVRITEAATPYLPLGDSAEPKHLA